MANTYWVAADADSPAASFAAAESDTPLSGAACCSLAAAIAGVAAGQTVYLRSGDYGTQLAPITSGTSGSKITWSRWEADGVNPRITGAGVSTLQGAIYLNDVSYQVLDGIDVHDVYRLCQLEGSSSFNEFKNFEWDLGNASGNGGVISDSLGTGTCTNNWWHDFVASRSGYVEDAEGTNDKSNLWKIGNPGAYANQSNNNTIEDFVLKYGGHHVMELVSEKNVVRNGTMHNEGWMDADGHTHQPESAGDPVTGLWGNRNLITYDGNSRGRFYNIIEGCRFGHAGPPSDGNGADNLTFTNQGNIARFNYCFNAGEKDLFFKQGTGSDGSDNRCYHNTCYQTQGLRDAADVVFIHTSSTGNVLVNNIIHSPTVSEADINPNGEAMHPLTATILNNFRTADGDPLFVNDDMSDPTSLVLPDLSVASSSPVINAGIALTEANGSGSDSTTLVVLDALFFQDGTSGSSLSDIRADWIAVGAVDNVAQIASIDYDTETITLEDPLTWSDGDDIWLFKDSSGTKVLYGTAPDIGAYQLEGLAPTTPPNPPEDLTLTAL